MRGWACAADWLGVHSGRARSALSDEHVQVRPCSKICKATTNPPRPACRCANRVYLHLRPPPAPLLPPTAGMGLPGLLCAKLGAQHVLLTDYEPVVVAQIQQNAELNAVAACCVSLALDWFDLAPLAPEQRHAFDLLLLADVIYAAAVVGPLVNTLRTLMRAQTGEGPGGSGWGRQRAVIGGMIWSMRKCMAQTCTSSSPPQHAF